MAKIIAEIENEKHVSLQIEVGSKMEMLLLASSIVHGVASSAFKDIPLRSAIGMIAHGAELVSKANVTTVDLSHFSDFLENHNSGDKHE